MTVTCPIMPTCHVLHRARACHFWLHVLKVFPGTKPFKYKWYGLFSLQSPWSLCTRGPCHKRCHQRLRLSKHRVISDIEGVHSLACPMPISVVELGNSIARSRDEQVAHANAPQSYHHLRLLARARARQTIRDLSRFSWPPVREAARPISRSWLPLRSACNLCPSGSSEMRAETPQHLAFQWCPVKSFHCFYVTH